MQHIPAGMQEPPDTYEIVGLQSLVSTVGDRDEKYKLPEAETPVQVRCASSAIMIALKLRLFGSLNKEQSEM
jgi:hypothetical protein